MPKIHFDEKPELEFRVTNFFVSFKENKIYDKFSHNGVLYSLRSNWIDRSCGNPFQDLIFMSGMKSQSAIHYHPTHLLRYKLKLLNLEDSLFYLHLYDEETREINFISIQIEIIPYGRF